LPPPHQIDNFVTSSQELGDLSWQIEQAHPGMHIVLRGKLGAAPLNAESSAPNIMPGFNLTV
jgi:hypothetical protein